MLTRDRFIPEDFTTAREDGRYESDVAWAHDMLMNMRPAYSLDMVTCAGDFPGWRAKVRSKLHELLQIPDPLPTVEFKLLKEEPREGYRLRTYEFYPEPKLAVRMLMLVPDEAAEGKVSPEAFPALADLALRDSCMATNLITPTREEVIETYRNAWEGRL